MLRHDRTWYVAYISERVTSPCFRFQKWAIVVSSEWKDLTILLISPGALVIGGLVLFTGGVRPEKA